LAIKKTHQFSANFVQFGTVHNVFAPEKDIILEPKRAIVKDMTFVTAVMINF